MRSIFFLLSVNINCMKVEVEVYKICSVLSGLYHYVYCYVCSLKSYFLTRGRHNTGYHRFTEFWPFSFHLTTFLPSMSTTTSRRMFLRLLMTAGGTVETSSWSWGLSASSAIRSPWKWVVELLPPLETTAEKDTQIRIHFTERFFSCYPGRQGPWTC